MRHALWMKSPASLCLLLFLSAGVAQGQNGRGFTGFYQASSPTSHGALVRVTLEVRIFNSTHGPVSGGSLRLRGSLPSHKDLGTINGVYLNRGGNGRLAGEFNIPLNEFQLWQKGGHPDLVIEFQDADGKLVSQAVELKRGRVGNEE